MMASHDEPAASQRGDAQQRISAAPTRPGAKAIRVSGARIRESLWNDSIHAARMIRSRPLLSAATICLVALSTSLACASFAVFDALMLRRLPVPHPEELVMIYELRPGLPTGRASLTSSLVREVRVVTADAARVFGFSGLKLPMTTAAGIRPGGIVGVDGDYFGALSVPPALGRVFSSDEQSRVAVISDALWRTEYSSSKDVLQQTVRLGSTTIPIIGVMPKGFVGTQPDAVWDVILPYTLFNEVRGVTSAQAAASRLEAGARLRHGVGASSLESRLNVAWPQILASATPSSRTLEAWTAERGTRIAVTSLATGLSYSKELEPNLSRSTAMTFLLALIVSLGCSVTLALLAVARTTQEKPRVAIMLALGGSSLQVMRPYALETAVVSTAGGALGLLVASWWVNLSEQFVTGAWSITVDSKAVAVASGLTIVAATISVFVAVLTVTRSSPSAALHSRATSSRSQVSLRTLLLSCQFGVSTILVYGAVTYIIALNEIRSIPIGLSTERVHSHTLSGVLPQRTLDQTYFRSLFANLIGLPGVELVSANLGAPPFYAGYSPQPVWTDESTQATGVILGISSGWFSTLGIPLSAGRDLTLDDERTAVISKRLADRLFPNRPAIGKIVKTSGTDSWEVVGVVGDIAFRGPHAGITDMVYVPMLQRFKPFRSAFSVALYLRASRSFDDLDPSVRREVDSMGAEYVTGGSSLDDQFAESIRADRMLALVAGTAGTAVALITAVGLYAFSAYLVVVRAKELAIRAALGASPRLLGVAALRDTLRVAGVGCLIGIGGSLVYDRIAAAVLAGFDSRTTLALSAAVCLMFAIGAVSSVVPFSRALRMDVARALRRT